MKLVGILFAVAGIAGSAISGAADYIGLNLTQENPDVAAFGWLQMLFVAIGVIVFLAGIVMFFVGSRKRKEEEKVVFEEEEEMQDTDPEEQEAATVEQEETFREEGPASVDGGNAEAAEIAQQQITEPEDRERPTDASQTGNSTGEEV